MWKLSFNHWDVQEEIHFCIHETLLYNWYFNNHPGVSLLYKNGTGIRLVNLEALEIWEAKNTNSKLIKNQTNQN